MIFMLIIIFMVFLSIFFFILFLLMILNNKFISMEMEIIKMISMKIEYYIILDWMSILFISLIFLITSMVLLYSFEYMENDLGFNRYMYMILLFMISMILMILSPNMISILLGWDGLGLTSYCLVIYYQSEESYNSGMITVLMNRVGDILILILIGLMMIYGSWNLIFMNMIKNIYLYNLILITLTKSAQIPFSSWLPKAMAAPTPISSLVHSSTLVTAGVYLMIRFSYLMKINKMVMFISLLTMLISSLTAIFEFDIKKIIALSTLSQLGVMMFCLSMGLNKLALFHLLIHALFKSMLFMCAGIFIHFMINNQDIRCLNMLTFKMPMVSMIMNCSIFSLCGIPFMSGFYSKDLIIEMFMMNLLNKFVMLILFMSMMLTVLYSFRMIYFSFVKFSMNNWVSLEIKEISCLMMWSMIILFNFSIWMGKIMGLVIFTNKNLIFLNVYFKTLIYYFIFFGIMLGIFINKYYIIFSKLSLYKIMVFFFNFMWLMYFLSKFMIKIFMFLFNKIFYILELGWNEYFYGQKMLMILLKLIMMMDLDKKDFLYLFIMILFILMIMLF